MFKTCLIFSILVIAIPFMASATVIWVPMNAPTIQAGIDMAKNGDTVALAPGVYSGDGNYHIDFKGKAITVKGSGSSTCFVEGYPYQSQEGFLFTSGEGRDSVLRDLTIRNFISAWNSAVYCESSSPTIANCYITSNVGGFGAITLAKSDALIEKCTIVSNRSTETMLSTGQGAGIYVYEGFPEIVNCSITSNRSEGDGGGLYSLNASVYLEACNILMNEVIDEYRETAGCGIFTENSELYMYNCLVHNNDTADFGGGLYCKDTKGMLLDVTITYNNPVQNGGGLYLENSSLVFDQCKINDNSAIYGAAVAVQGGSPEFDGCTFSGNSGIISGAVYMDECTSVLRNCEFTGNESEWGAGLYFEYSTVNVFDCVFEGNNALNGAGIFLLQSESQIWNSEFSDNTAEWGGGILMSMSSPDIHGCKFVGNSTTTYLNDERGGAILVHRYSDPLISSCEFVDNYSYTYGGAIFTWNLCNPEIRNCLIVNNQCDGKGGGIFCETYGMTVESCTIADNISPEGGGIYCSSNSSVHVKDSIIFRNKGDQIKGNPVVSFSDVEGGYPGDHNIAMKPLLTSGPLGDYYLTFGPGFVSPCINAGSDYASKINVHGLIYMNHLTTRSDNQTDTGMVDMGYHYPVAK